MSEAYGVLGATVPGSGDYVTGGADVPKALREYSDSFGSGQGAGKLLVVQSTGAAAWKAMSGDGTLAKDGTLTLTSPNNGVYRTILEAQSILGGGQFIGTYLLGSAGAGTGPLSVEAAQSMEVTGSSSAWSPPPLIALGPTSYAVAGKTTKLRTEIIYSTNSTASELPGLKFFLFPITSSGEANKLVLTTGAAFGTELKISEPPKDRTENRVSADFDLPSPGGIYALGVQLAQNMPAGRVIALTARLTVRNV